MTVELIRGDAETRRVFVVSEDGTERELSPGPSQEIYNHSPDGFNWGYSGSGPAQLALAILLGLCKGAEFASANYQRFKEEIIATLPQNEDFVLEMSGITTWVRERFLKTIAAPSLGFYILDGKDPVLCDDLMQWAEWRARDNRSWTVKSDALVPPIHWLRLFMPWTLKADNCTVSTVFLGLDHSFGPGPPLVFETMVFGGKFDGYMDRYSTWTEAERGHERIKQMILRGKKRRHKDADTDKTDT